MKTENIAEYRKQYREKNKEKIKEAQKKWEEAHKEERKAYMKRLYQEKIEERRQYGKEYAKKNKEKLKAYSKGRTKAINTFIEVSDYIKKRKTILEQIIKTTKKKKELQFYLGAYEEITNLEKIISKN